METCDPVMSLTLLWRAASNARDHPIDAVAIGDRDGGQSEPGCRLDQLLGMTGALQEGEIGLAPERDVHGHRLLQSTAPWTQEVPVSLSTKSQRMPPDESWKE